MMPGVGSKGFRRPAQLQQVFRKLWRGFCRHPNFPFETKLTLLPRAGMIRPLFKQKKSFRPLGLITADEPNDSLAANFSTVSFLLNQQLIWAGKFPPISSKNSNTLLTQ